MDQATNRLLGNIPLRSVIRVFDVEPSQQDSFRLPKAVIDFVELNSSHLFRP